MELNIAQLMTVEYFMVAIGLFLGIKCISLKKDNMNYFMRFIYVLNAFLIVNIPVRMVELHSVRWNKEFVFWLYAVSVVLMTFTMYYWFVFVLRQFKSPLISSVKRIIIWAIPAIGVIPLCIANRVTGWLYFIDDASYYHRGSVFVLQAAISYAYFALIVFLNIYYLFWGKEKEAVRKCIGACIPAIVAAYLQIVYGGSYLLAGTLVGALIMYIEICLDRQKAYEVANAVSRVNNELIQSNKEIESNMRTIFALSDMYHIIYDVNLVNDEFVEIKSTENLSKYCSNYTKASECLAGISDTMFEEIDIRFIKEFYKYSTIQERTKKNNVIFVEGRGINIGWLRSSIVVVERDEDGNATHVLFTVQNINDEKEKQKKIEDAVLDRQHAEEMKDLFYQIAKALSGAIDAKDKYTHGHSVRVAKYSQRIAKMAGMSEDECEKIFLAGLLHDVGKIGIKDAIINKEGKLTDDEYNEIKKHSVLGKEILAEIDKLPYLSIGANYHHERYDGKGYPKGLKGNDIPAMARIIAVADAYDAMTSKRSYREIIPQAQVREQIVMGRGTQFDPEYAGYMMQLIDDDFAYVMKEKLEGANVSQTGKFEFEKYMSSSSEGIWLIDLTTFLKMHFRAYDNNKNMYSMPTLVIYDSFDAKIQTRKEKRENLRYYEYLTIRMDGKVDAQNIRKIQSTRVPDVDIDPIEFAKACIAGMDIDVEMVRVKDHIRIRITNPFQKLEYIVAIEDGIRYAYGAITGENCEVEILSANKATEHVHKSEIPRIAEEITFANGPEGDIPNLQVDAWRMENSEAIKIDGRKEITLHSLSLPTSRLIWHCPFAVLYSSDDNTLSGENYKEYALIRMDGESWSSEENVINKYYINTSFDFDNWNTWKAKNKAGVDCSIIAERKDRVINIVTENSGLELHNTITLPEGTGEVYMVLTGDQIAMTNIRIK